MRTVEARPFIAVIESHPGVRYTFLVTHGPFTPSENGFPVSHFVRPVSSS